MRRLSALLVAFALAWCLADPALAQSSVGGDNQFHLIAANSDNAKLIQNGPAQVHGVQLSGLGSAPGYLKFYDKSSTPVCGTDTPKKVLMIPAASTAANGAGSNVTISLGSQFFNGIGICVTTGIADSDDTAVAAATFNINFDWK